MESQRELVLGIAYNNNSNPQKALPHLIRAADLLVDSTLVREKFIANYNLFIVYLNLKNLPGMEQTLDSINEFTPTKITQKLEIHRLKMAYYSYTGNFFQAKNHLRGIEAKSEHLTELQKAAFQIDKFIFYVKQEQYKECEQIIIELKHKKKYISYGNLLFMKQLLDFVQGKTKLYVYPQDFLEHPILYHQIKTLLALEINDLKSAMISWEFLNQQSPGIYGKDFTYLGDKCLFSIALNKIRNLKHSVVVENIKIECNKGELVDSLIEAMKRHGGHPVAKDQLYFDLYGETPKSQEDLNKLSCTVKRLRRKYNLEIKSQKGTYIITGKKSA